MSWCAALVLMKKYHGPPQHHPLNMPLLTTCCCGTLEQILHQHPCTLAIRWSTIIFNLHKANEVRSTRFWCWWMVMKIPQSLKFLPSYALSSPQKVCRNKPPCKVYWFAQYTMQMIQEPVRSTWTMSRGREVIVAYERPSHPIQHRNFTHICTWLICLKWLCLDGFRVFEANSSVKTTINTIMNCILCRCFELLVCDNSLSSILRPIHLEITYLW